MNTIDPSIWQTAVSGLNLSPGNLQDQLNKTPTLLVFLRHFG